MPTFQRYQNSISIHDIKALEGVLTNRLQLRNAQLLGHIVLMGEYQRPSCNQEREEGMVGNPALGRLLRYNRLSYHQYRHLQSSSASFGAEKFREKNRPLASLIIATNWMPGGHGKAYLVFVAWNCRLMTATRSLGANVPIGIRVSAYGGEEGAPVSRTEISRRPH